MSLTKIIIVLFVAFGIYSVVTSGQVCKEGRRIAVFRLGRLIRILEPGFHVLLPLIDKAKDIDLKTEVPGWENMTKKEIEDKIVSKIAGNRTLRN